MIVETDQGYHGNIIGSFGSGGKFRVKFPTGAKVANGSKITLKYKKFLFDKSKGMTQSGMEVQPSNIDIVEEQNNFKHQRQSKKKSKGDQNEQFNGSVDQSSTNNSVNTIVAEALTSTPSELHERDGDQNASSKAPIKPLSDSEDSSIDIRYGLVDALKGDRHKTDGDVELYDTFIVKGAFRMEENIRLYAGSIAYGPNGAVGELMGPFAKMGKCKVYFPNGCHGTVGETQIIIHATCQKS
jgi:hypothetical protein